VDRAGTNEASRREAAPTTSDHAADNSHQLTHLAEQTGSEGSRDSTRLLDARVRETAAGAEAQGMKWRPNRRDVGRKRTWEANSPLPLPACKWASPSDGSILMAAMGQLKASGCAAVQSQGGLLMRKKGTRGVLD
jgi:hypothetical protein